MRLHKILETCLYVADLDRCEAFYVGLLGAVKYARQEGRHVFFRVGDSMLLCFLATATAAATEKTPHGAHGCQHVAFEVPHADYESWKRKLDAAGVAIVDEIIWRPTVRSCYFHDPDGHLLEIAEPGLWA